MVLEKNQGRLAVLLQADTTTYIEVVFRLYPVTILLIYSHHF